jgi:sigma-B regulation protein RsbU (phosphoserine phosphatase)
MDILRLRRIASQIRQKEETERGLRMARLRQDRMLPEKPVIPGYDFAVKYEPASHVSGDFYDFFTIREGVLGIVIGDVSGHGVEAGIIMGMAKQTVSIYGRQMENPKEVLQAANEELYRSLDGRTFVSLSYAVLDVEGRALRFARAGQNRPFLMNARWQNPKPQVVESKGLALGVDKGTRFAQVVEEIPIKLQPGDFFFQYTDGLVEAMNQDKEQYGEERLCEVLSRYARTSATELLEIVIESLHDFTRPRAAAATAPAAAAKEAEQEDDITMVAFKVRGPESVSRTASFSRAEIEAFGKEFPPPGAAPAQPKAPAGRPEEKKPEGEDRSRPPSSPELPDWLK